MNNLAFTSRELKGFNFENLIGKSVNEYGFLHNGFRGSGSDFKHEYYPIELEAKFSHAIIYPSWVKRDWLSRFSNAKFKVVVSNRGMKLSDRCLKLLKVNGIIHVYFDQLKETVELLIALCSSEGVTSYGTNKGGKCKCFSVESVKDYSLNSFNNVDLAEDYCKFLFSQNIKSRLSEDTMKLLRKIHENNLPIEIIFINNQKEMDKFIENLKRKKEEEISSESDENSKDIGNDKAEDPNKYNENVNYKKEFSKTIKEIRKNKPKLSREEKQLLKFREQLKTSILEKGLLNKITLTNYGILDGEDRFRILQELKLVEVPVLTNDLFCKEFADKYPQYFTWKEVKDYKEFKELRVISSLSRKLRRKEIEEYCKLIEGTIPDNQIANFIVEKFSKYISNATLYRWIPSKYKHKQTFSNEKNLPEGMNILQKPQTVTFSIRTTKSQKERFYELCKKHGLQVNDVVKQLIDEWIKKMTNTVVSSEDTSVEQQPEIKQTIEHAEQILASKQEEPKIIEYQPSKFDFCNVCNKTTKHIWSVDTQSYLCDECYRRELNKVTKQTPAKVVIGRRE